MIYIAYRGRLGNRLIQYCLARILSKKFNEQISHPEIKFFKPRYITNYKIHKKNILVDDNNFLEILQLENLEPANLVLSGYFQDKLFLSEYRKEILQLIKFTWEEKEGIFIHYRLGDCLTNNNGSIRLIPAQEYYMYCLDEILKTSNQQVYISSDSPNHDRVTSLSKKYKANIINFENPIIAMFYGSQFKNKILSLGTFSWWIGFLGNQNNIYYPDGKECGYNRNIFNLEEWKYVKRKKYLLKKEQN